MLDELAIRGPTLVLQLTLFDLQYLDEHALYYIVE